MLSTRRYIRLTMLGAVFLTGPAVAQNAQRATWQPVDQTVSDLDLRASSLRYVEQGIGAFGQTGSLYRRTDSSPVWLGSGEYLSQQYQVRKPGFTAYIDRPDYLVIDPQGEMRLNVTPSADGHYRDIIPPNTVFDLVPLSERITDPAYYNRDDNNWDDMRLNFSVDCTVRGEITGELAPPAQFIPLEAHRLPQHLIEQRKQKASSDTTNESVVTDESATQTDPAQQDIPSEQNSQDAPAVD